MIRFHRQVFLDARLGIGVAILFGFILVFWTPPFQAPDEINHFYRAYEVSEGHVLSEKRGKETGREVPTSLIQMSSNLSRGVSFRFDQKFDSDWYTVEKTRALVPEQRSFVSFPNTALYSPVAYAPQALGIALFRIFGVTPLTLFFAARLFNFFTAMVLSFLALRENATLFPILSMVLLLPMTLFLMASISADSSIFGFSFLLFSLMVARLQDRPDNRLSNKFVVFLCFTLLILCKPVYVSFGLPLLIVEGRRDLKRKGRMDWLKTSLGFAIAAIALLAWNHASQTIFNALRTDVVIDPEAQLRWVKTHLGAAGFLFGHEIYRHIVDHGLLQSGIGSLLGWLDTPLNPTWMKVHLLLLLVIGILCPIPFLTRPGVFLWGLVGAMIGGSLLITLAMYLTWTAVGVPIVEGLQGRYFIPFFPMLMFLFAYFGTRFRSVPPWTVGLLSLTSSSALLVHTLWAIKIRYYG